MVISASSLSRSLHVVIAPVQRSLTAILFPVGRAALGVQLLHLELFPVVREWLVAVRAIHVI